MKKLAFIFSILVISTSSFAQYRSNLSESAWVDSVFKSLSKDEKIAQLMVIRAHSNLGADHVAQVSQLVSKYNVGALCFFQGGPGRQAILTNRYQSLAKTPLMVTIDAEWGLGMRLDSVIDFPYQLTLGALRDDNIVYRLGQAVGEQCKRLGIHVNYAPVVDINNNPNNPVIGYRSFGEDKYQVAKLGVAYMRGMQDAGIMACAKHFPGHGDTEVDSHYDLPVINKTKAQLDSLELFPFRALFEAGVGSVMIAHLYIPSVDNTANRATSLSKGNVTDLLRFATGFKGLTFTDALEMKGVTKFFPGGEAAVEALIAGNDMLCLPESVPDAIEEVKKAIKKKRLSWNDIDEKLLRVLHAKYQLGLNRQTPIELNNLLQDLNAKTDDIRREISSNIFTMLSSADPLPKHGQKIAYVGLGTSTPNLFGRYLRDDWNADVFTLSYKDDPSKANDIAALIAARNYDAVIIGVHDFALRPANNYNISKTSIDLAEKLQSHKTHTIVFGNVYAVKNFCSAKNLVAAYQDDDITQQAAADFIAGKIKANGKLPVSVCQFKYGAGMVSNILPFGALSSQSRFQKVDSLVLDAIEKKAFPGAVVLAAKDGELIYHKAFGNYRYEPSPAVTLESIFDLASVTKISATTLAVMKMYEEGRIELHKTLGDYLPWVRGTNKEGLKIRDILLHEAGLVPFIPFYRETIDSATGTPINALYRSKGDTGLIRVAENLYLRKEWNDTMFSRILNSPLGPVQKYVYSDNDFIFLGKIIEQVSGLTLDQYVKKNFYDRMGMSTTGFLARKRFPLERIVPTEEEKHFRQQLIWGDVHDEGASMFGGVAGHAGLFSTAYDLSMLYQMLLNGGEFNGTRYLQQETIKLFTSYQSKSSRRGLGFDKPEKDNHSRTEPYPATEVSEQTFGHTGFTGTCVWVDPKYNLVYIFLSNRVYPTRNNPRLSQLNVRANVQDAIYEVIKSDSQSTFTSKK